MGNTRPPTAAERQRWVDLITTAKIAKYHLNICEARSHQQTIVYEFALAEGETLETLPPTIAMYYELEDLQKRAKQLKKILYACHTNVLELHFPDGPTGDIQIFGYPGMNEDELQAYSLTGEGDLGILVVTGILIGVLIVGAIGGTGAYFYIDHLQTKNDALAERFYTNTELLNNKYCADPNAPVCGRFLDFRTAQGYQTDEDYIEAMKKKIAQATSDLGQGLSHGISYAIPIIAGVGLVYYLLTRKK